MEKCSKCNTESGFLVKYTDLDTFRWALCSLCNTAYDIPHVLLKEFMKDDFGFFPISPITRDMINARKARAAGESPWQKSD